MDLLWRRLCNLAALSACLALTGCVDSEGAVSRLEVPRLCIQRLDGGAAQNSVTGTYNLQSLSREAVDGLCSVSADSWVLRFDGLDFELVVDHVDLSGLGDAVGTEFDVEFQRMGFPFSEHALVHIRDAEGLRVYAENELRSAPPAGFSVDVGGTEHGREELACRVETYRSLAVEHAGQTLEVRSGESARLSANGTAYVVSNHQNIERKPAPGCEDFEPEVRTALSIVRE